MPGFKQIKDKNHDTCFFGRHRGFSFTFFIYANNEPKSALARELGDCRDNKGNIVFLEVRPSLRRIPASDNALYVGDRDKRVRIF